MYINVNISAVESIQNNRDELFDLDTSAMSGIIELDTSQANYNAICKYNSLYLFIKINYLHRYKCVNFYILVADSIQSNRNELIDLNASMMSGIIELNTSQTDNNTISKYNALYLFININ